MLDLEKVDLKSLGFRKQNFYKLLKFVFYYEAVAQSG
jgi:hypothetical protein